MTPEVKERIEQIRHGIVPEGYKKTATGIIPNDWQCSAICDCLKVKNSERKPISEEVRKNIPGPYPYYGPTQAQGYIDSYVSEGPAVLIGEDGDHFLKYKSKPMTLFVDGKYTVNNHAHIVVGTEKCGTKWFFYAYQHKSLLNAITRQGAGRFKLTKEALEKLLVQYPSLGEQEKIIDVIAVQDKTIELKEKLLAEKQRQKKYLMQQLLTGKKRLPGFLGTWKSKQIGDVLSIRHGKNQQEIEQPTGKYPILGTGGEIGRTDQFLCDKPSVLLGRKGTINNPRYMDTPFWTIDTLYYTEIKSGNSAKYLYYVFCNINWMQYNEASGVPSLNSHTIESVRVSLPDINEQTAIAGVLTDFDNEISLLNKNLEQEKRKKKALMQLLLTGIVRV